jgi:hypothetical protein
VQTVHENLSDIIQVFLNTCVCSCTRSLGCFQNKTSIWRDACLRFENFVLICQDILEAVTVLKENWAIASKDLIFSANWLIASANTCRPMPFKLYEQLSLLVTIPKRCEGKYHIYIPYQMKVQRIYSSSSVISVLLVQTLRILGSTGIRIAQVLHLAD